MSTPVRLELLTRKAGEPGFHLYEIQSSQAYLLFKPARPPETEWELTAQPRSFGGGSTYILRSLRSDRYLLLTHGEYFLWELFDGRHSMSDIARVFFFEFGSFDYNLIRQLLGRLHHAGLLQVPQASDLQRFLAGQRGRWWARLLGAVLKARKRISFRMLRADRFCSTLYNRGGFLLVNPVAFWTGIALMLAATLAAAALAPEGHSITLRLAGRPLLTTGFMILSVLVASMFHVLVHDLTCKSYGRKVREMGFFLLQGILPTFYADVTDIFMSSRRARVVVSLAGPMVDVVVGSFAFIGALWAGPGMIQSILFGVGLLEWESAVLNLYPFNFLEMDGYNILVDLLAMPTLRQQAWTLLRKLPERLFSGKRFDRSEWIQMGYLALCLISVLAYLAAHLDAIGLKLAAWRQG